MNEEQRVLQKVLIVGCGDVGVRVARLVRARGGLVTAVARSHGSEARLEELGLKIVPGNLDDPGALDKLEMTGKMVFYLAPPPGGGPFDSRMRNFCQAIGKDRAPAKIVYVSTSGVYGDCGGEWVTEETPINPQTSRAQRRADAEATLREWGQGHGVPVVILRVTGIYGPGR
ncbi:MAG TPA: NAD-dependent epimerase/dehydratase family protein, partial [Desulfurivibrionaceae bacterium]|nr:NAD-dependent epimerase/dehydratase family protein [Desulfurivibrionaceae bacterium]